MKRKKLILLILTGLIISSCIPSCTFEEPTLPSWYTQWSFPIPNPGFEMSEAVNDSTIIDTTYQGQSIIAVSIIDSTERQQISREDLAILPDSDSTSQTLGDVSLDSPGTEESDPVPVEDVLGFPVIEGQFIDIPEIDVTPPSIFVTFSSFEFIVDVKEGQMNIEFHNDSFLEFRSNLNISVYDSISGEFVGETTAPDPIDAHSVTQMPPVDLAGQQFSNHLRFELLLPVKRVDNYQVQAGDAEGFLQFLSTITDMKVGYAMAQIPRQEFSRRDSVSMQDEEDRMRTATVDDGTFLLEIENTLNVTAHVDVELLNFYNDENYTEVFSEKFVLPAASDSSFTVRLDDKYIVKYLNGPAPGGFIDYMKYRFFVETEPTLDMVEASETDEVRLTITPIDSVYVSEFDGYLAERQIDFDPQEQNEVIDAEGFEGSLRLEELTMTLNVYNQVGIDMDVKLNIVGYKNAKADSFPLIFGNNIINVDRRLPGEEVRITTVDLTAANSNIVEFIEFLPEDIITTGYTIIEGTGKVALSDEVWSDYHIFSPFFLKIQNDARYTSELDSINGDDGVSDAIERGDVDNAFIDLGLINGLPIGAVMKVYFSTNPDDLFDETIIDSTQKLVIDDIQFASGELNNDGFVVEVYEEPYQRALTQKELLVLANPTVYVAARLFLDDTDGLVKFRTTDEIRANGTLQIRYRMNNED